MSSVAVRKAWYDSVDSLYEYDSPPNSGENTRQTKLYNFDPRMAHPKYGEDLAAMRATDEEVLGSGLKPTSQPRHNIEWEEGVSELLGSNPRYPDEEMHEVTHHGVKYLMRPDGKVQFPIKEGDKGVWLARPTESDASPGGLFTHRDADKLVFVRGKPESLRGMGRAYERNSDEARENVAEMFLQRKKPIDPDRLVQVPIPKDKQMWQVLRDLGLTGGTDKHGRSKWGSKIPIKKKMPLRNLLTGISSLKPSFEYQGNFAGRPMGLVSYDSSQGIGRRSLPFYQRTGRGGSESGAKAGQWAPFHGIDVEGQHFGDKDWFVKPNKGLGDQYDESAGKRYGHSRLQGLGEWLDANSPEFEERHIDNGRTANQWMIDRNAEFMDPSALGHASPTPEKTTGRAEGFKMGEPMDIAFQLLKDDSDEKFDFGRFRDKDYRYEQTYGDLRNNQEVPMKDARFGPSSDRRDQRTAEEKRNIIDNVDRLQHEEFNHRLQLGNYLTRPHGDMSNEKLRERLATVRPYVLDAEGRIAPVPHERFHPNSSPTRWTLEREMNLRELESQPTTFYEENPFSEQFQDIHTGEPMDIAYQLLKDRKSPEAWAHKLEYDKQYQKNPKRVKYREQLNAERRKRGIYGKGGGDVSHTQGGKLTLENPSSNRARHFKGKGTLRRVKVK